MTAMVTTVFLSNDGRNVWGERTKEATACESQGRDEVADAAGEEVWDGKKSKRKWRRKQRHTERLNEVESGCGWKGASEEN
eukprot:3079004-Pleurochrysis_carterae.AAC.2